ncbi:DUF1758 domain-containing protein [Caerostris darwini]|uniref:DUF1758 domain-containing protein n=1 Tax=Caerostris darwini TaxID=1538125 RepID=A0AAV4MIN4_9ARAC|nr:DUF1758 domain-containing protein [Caerostris darwini]
MLYPVVEFCLPAEILKAWDRYRHNREVKEDSILMKEKVLENLMSFLRHEVEGEEHRVLAETAFGNGMKRKDTHKPVHKGEPTAATLIANFSAGKNNCVFCDRSHPSQECQKISNMNYDDRKKQVMHKRCCLVCLKPGHMAKKCHSNVRCLICERRHYVLLCPDLRKGIPKSKVADEEAKSTKILLTNLLSEYEIYFKTIIVRLRHKGKEVCVRALRDDGSYRSYIEKSLAAELNLSPSGTEVLSQGLFGSGISSAAEHGRFSVTIESETIRFQEDQRYEVVLPWLAGHPPVYDVAESRLRSVTKRLAKENIFEVYDDVLRQWQKEGIIETIPKNEISRPGHHLPHMPVIKSSSLTTKVHPVFDASFKQPGYSSLSDCLSAGPNLSEQIPPLLLRFHT